MYNVRFYDQLYKLLRTQQLLGYKVSLLQLGVFQDVLWKSMDTNQFSTNLSPPICLFKYADWITQRNLSRLTKTENSEQNLRVLSCVYLLIFK